MSAVIRLDKIKATAHIVTGVCASDLEQGSLVVAGAYDTTNGTYTIAANGAITDAMLLVASTPLGYVEPDFETSFTNELGDPVRCYQMEKGDVVTISDSNITGTTVVAQYVIPAQSAVKMAAAASLGGTENLAFKVLRKTTLAGAAATMLEVVKA